MALLILLEPRWPNFERAAIDLYHISSENGFGRWEIAEAVARVFPNFRAWALRSTEGLDRELARGLTCTLFPPAK